MTSRDQLRALGVLLVLGLQFPATTLALEVFPPFVLATLRFALVAVPTVLLVRRPAVPWRWLIGYGLGIGVGEFALLYLALRAGLPAGLASLVLQSAAPFTVLLAAALLRERPSGRQNVGLAVALLGLGLVVLHHLHGAVLGPLLLCLGAGLSWAVGNICARRAAPARPVDFTLWMTVVPPVPMAVLSLAVEGPHGVAHAARRTADLDRTAVVAVLALVFIAVVCTVVGTGGWAALLVRYPSHIVAPLSLLVPVIGTASSAVVLGERLDGTTLAAGVVILAGLLVITTGRAGDRTPRAPGRQLQQAAPARSSDSGAASARTT